jgi:hypothetical protein
MLCSKWNDTPILHPAFASQPRLSGKLKESGKCGSAPLDSNSKHDDLLYISDSSTATAHGFIIGDIAARLHPDCRTWSKPAVSRLVCDQRTLITRGMGYLLGSTSGFTNSNLGWTHRPGSTRLAWTSAIHTKVRHCPCMIFSSSWKINHARKVDQEAS